MQRPDDPQRTTPLGMIRYSIEFYEAARAVDDAIGARPGYVIVAPVPAMYLIGHSIELSLKSFLLHKGTSLKSLRRKPLSHDLLGCLNSAIEKGLSNTIQVLEPRLGALQALNNLYRSKELNYIVTGEKDFPAFGLIQSLSFDLIEGLAPEVGYSGTPLDHTILPPNGSN